MLILSDKTTRELLPGVAAGPLGFLSATAILAVPVAALPALIVLAVVVIRKNAHARAAPC